MSDEMAKLVNANPKISGIAVTAERERWLDIIAQWANDEGISFDATTRLSKALGLEP